LTLPKLLAGKQVRLRPSIGSDEETISGTAAPRDLSTALQLLYLYFTAPRKDTALYSSTVDKYRQSLDNRYANPNAVLQDTLSALLGGYHPRRMPVDSSFYERVNLDRMMTIYRERFANAGDFTFY